jgi:arylsulfatase A-like enzyme
MTRPPNILYLHSHDTGQFVEPYGFAVATPNIVTWPTRACSSARRSAPSRRARAAAPVLLTGQYGHSNGMLGLAHRGFSLRDYREHVVNTLRPAGYWSALIGEQHISKRPDVIGYDRVVKVPPPT